MLGNKPFEGGAAKDQIIQVGGGQLNMCHTLPRVGYKSPYNRRVESRDSEEGEAGRPKGSPPIVATYSHS